MTEEERLRQAIMRQRMNPMSAPMTMGSQVQNQLAQPLDPSKIPGSPQVPGMPATPPTLEEQYYVAPEADLTTQSDNLASQRALGRSLLMQETPGTRRVGPTGIDTVNYAEGLSSGLQKALGGYMTAKAGKESKALDAEKGEAAETRARSLAKASAEEERTRRGERAEDVGREVKGDREYGEWSVGGGDPIRGYVEEGIAYDEKGSPLPAGAKLQPKITRGSGSQFQVNTETDEFGNVVSRSFDKATNTWSEPTFIDNTPYSEEEAASRGEARATQEGREKFAGANATSNVEGFEDAYKAKMSMTGQVEQLKKAREALNEGANTGPVAGRLPAVKGASVRLENARDTIALYSIADYTFGSLSEAEGMWLKDTSIPLTLSEEELGAYIDKRITALERAMKAEEYMMEMRANNQAPSQKVIDQIKYGKDGQFKFRDDEEED